MDITENKMNLSLDEVSPKYVWTKGEFIIHKPSKVQDAVKQVKEEIESRCEDAE